MRGLVDGLVTAELGTLPGISLKSWTVQRMIESLQLMDLASCSLGWD